jgi:plastocyanin
MHALKSNQGTFSVRWPLLLTFLAVPLGLFGQSSSWMVKVGSQVPDCLVGAPSDMKLAEGCQSHQALAFIPNEIWIHQNDNITWTQATEENHTVTFLYEPQPTPLGVPPYPAAQQRQSNAVGCSAYGGVTSPNNSAYDPSGAMGLKCVSSGVLPNYGSTFTVSFPSQGNFKFTCLIHASMYGTKIGQVGASKYEKRQLIYKYVVRAQGITPTIRTL